MIGIFALLAVAMLLVVKLCKNTLKIVLSIIIILLTLYTVMVSIDINRVESFREPIFAISSELRDYENHSKEVYKGLGYRIEIDRVENQKIISSTMYFFDKVVAGAIE
ncbi:MAG: hypothetical protein IJO57_01130 [Bacilli bacterium]|nr:hypothetical protein [Clostridia bacterium]MBQ9853620.1 hypothetical protein [Bacilli bacterium]